jgi:hypothetical protein
VPDCGPALAHARARGDVGRALCDQVTRSADVLIGEADAAAVRDARAADVGNAHALGRRRHGFNAVGTCE